MQDVVSDFRKCMALLPPEAGRRCVAMLPLSAAAAAAEAVGAAAVFALVKVAGDPARAAEIPVAGPIVRALAPEGGQSVIVAFALIVVAIYVLKSAILATVLYVQEKVVSESIAALSCRMLEGYLGAPYAFHLTRNSATLVERTSGSPRMLFHLVLGSTVALVTEALVVAGITLVLLVEAPVVTLAAAGVLGLVVTALVRGTRRAAARLGAREAALQEGAVVTLQHALGALKEVTLLGRERHFLERFRVQQAEIARARHRFALMSNLPRLLIETVFVVGVLFVVFLVATRGGDPGEMMPLLGLFAYAGFRVIPSANRFVYHLNNIRYGASFVQGLYEDQLELAVRPLDGQESLEVDAAPLTGEIALERVSYRYAGVAGRALDGVDLAIARGESVGIVGPTGSGKSTLANVVLGLLEPTGGRVLVDGEPLSLRRRAWRRTVGYVPQDVFLADDTIRNNVALGVDPAAIEEDRVRTAVRLARLDEVVDALPGGLDAVVGERGVRLSGGQRQRVAIARALYADPQVLVFDEATAALDAVTEREVVRAVESLRGDRTLIVIAHRLGTVRRCDRIAFMRDGRVEAVGPYDALLAMSPGFRAMAAAAEGEPPGAPAGAAGRAPG